MEEYQFLEALGKEQEKEMIYTKNLKNQVLLMPKIYLNLKSHYALDR